MSPQKKKKLSLIRKKLDKLDNSLIYIIKKRTFLVKEVLKLKEYIAPNLSDKIIKIIYSYVDYVNWKVWSKRLDK